MAIKTVKLPIELIEKLKFVLIHNAGDHRRCPKCRHAFVPDDPAASGSWEVYQAIELYEKMQGTDK